MFQLYSELRKTHLLVQEDIDNWIVHCGGLRKAGGNGRQPQVKGVAAIVDNPKSKGGIRHPAHEKAQHHDNHHPGHLSLCFLGGGRLCLGLGCLLVQSVFVGQL